MSRSSEFYTRVKVKRENRILKFNESEDFLDFNDFGPDRDTESEEMEKTMTLDEFVNLEVFTTENLQRAILALKNNETIELINDDETVKMSSSDNEVVTVEYYDIQLDFDKTDLLNAFEEIVSLAVVESVNVVEEVDKTEVEEKEMPSVLKFKEFLEIEKNETKQDGKDSF